MGKLMVKYAADGALLADMPADSIICCTSHAEIAGLLRQTITTGDVILIKGSRGMTMEKVAAELKNMMQQAKGE
jgi:UDP-N-acetylmuramoyl-tripeptide--D-alanyl-D-alanine ligase